jgi:phospholipid/cholesterol/gamma-HCH transport system substrate-binding protein
MKVKNLTGKALALGVLAVGAAVILAFFYTVAGGKLPFSGHRYTIVVKMDQPQQLLKHADVRAAGVKVGTVRNLVNRGPVADVTLELDSELAPVYRNATVLVRQKTLVGENYVDLTRGHPRTGTIADGGVLPLQNAKDAVPIDDVLRSLNPTVRRDISRNLRSLGTAFDGTSPAVNRLFANLGPALDSGSTVMGVLDQQREQVARLVDNTATVLQAVADRGQDVQTLVRSAKQTAEAVASRDQRLEEGLELLPPTLSQARSSVAKLSRFSGRATPVVSDLRVALVDLRPAIADLRPAATAATSLFRALPPLLKRAEPLLARLRTFSATVPPALPKIAAFLKEANPFLAYLKPYSRDIGGALANFGTPSGQDRFGSFARCGCAVGERSLSNYTPEMEKAVKALTDAGLIPTAAKMVNNPLRTPDAQPNSTTPFLGKYPRIEADK